MVNMSGTPYKIYDRQTAILPIKHTSSRLELCQSNINPSWLYRPSFHYLTTTFSVLQSEQRGVEQLGQVSVLILILVSPQEHFAKRLASAQLQEVRSSGGRTQDQIKAVFFLPFEGGRVCMLRGWAALLQIQGYRA